MFDRHNFQSIYQTVASFPAFSDHDHHLEDAFFREGMTLDRLLQHSYVSWTGYAPEGTYDSRKRMLEHVRYNSYFTWFQKGLQLVHGLEEPITLDNWDAISETIAQRYSADPDFHWRALKEHGFETLILDTYWNPGGDNGHDTVFIPTFRIDKFMYGYHGDSEAPNQFYPWKAYGFHGTTLQEYISSMRDIIIRQWKAGRVVAFKCAEAYLRTISFMPDDERAARDVFGTTPERTTEQQRILFGNYVFNRCAELAAELDVPFQIHTGLARLEGSQPMNLEPVIMRHPQTRFVLFHSGFPWVHEVAGLAHNHGNVYPSLTWTATICTSAAVRALHDYIDVTPSINTITWGSDCWVPEDSVGALLAWRYTVANVLEERYTDGRLTLADVEILAKKLMYENGRSIYMKRP